ncbi:MAG: zinc ribbon domain-containing protein [Clostridia bacterium]|nr:zinc ribbon domain-containing protein [Clostridia bacterium]
MIYSVSKCPNCRKIVKNERNPVCEIGVPFETCPFCGTIYLNRYKEEWITKSPIKRFLFFIQAPVWARAFLIPLLAQIPLIIIFENIFNPTIFFIIWYILFVSWLTLGYFLHKNANKEKIYLSILRTKNSEYLKLLKLAGYKIYSVDKKDFRPKDFDISKPFIQENIKTTESNDSKSSSNEKNNPFFDKEFSSSTINKEICYCRICGNKLIDEATYCNKCGTKVNKDNEL